MLLVVDLGSSLAGMQPLYSLTLSGRLPVSPNLHRTTIKEGTTLNSKRMVANIAHDMGLRFQDDTAALNRALNRPVHNQLLGVNRSLDVSICEI